MGVSVQQYGGLCQWLINVLNVVSGNFDRAGGAMFTSPAVDIVGITAAQGGRGHFDRYRSRVRNLPEFGGELPVAVLAEEILTPGKGQIRAMLTVAGNPLLSTPNTRQLERAFESLDFMVSVDYFLNETSRHADLILPPCGPLERDHYDVIFNALAVRNVAKYSTALFKPKAGVLQDWQILLELTKRLNRGDLKKRLTNRLTWAVMGWLKPEGVLNKMLKSGKSGLDLNALKKQPEGIDLGALQPVMPKRLFTRDKRLNLTPDVYLNALAQVASELQQPLTADGEFLLIGRRHIRSNNSWLHNSKRLVKGKSRCTLMLNPVDAERLGIADGVSVRVRSRVAELEVVAEVTDELMPGVVSIPHGWGHNVPGIRLTQAQEVAGVNTNDLTDDQLLDGLTGNAALNGVPVQLQAIA